MPKMEHIEEEAYSSGSSKMNSDAEESDRENRKRTRRRRSNSTGKSKTNSEKNRQFKKTTTFVSKSKLSLFKSHSIDVNDLKPAP